MSDCLLHPLNKSMVRKWKLINKHSRKLERSRSDEKSSAKHCHSCRRPLGLDHFMYGSVVTPMTAPWRKGDATPSVAYAMLPSQLTPLRQDLKLRLPLERVRNFRGMFTREYQLALLPPRGCELIDPQSTFQLNRTDGSKMAGN